MQLIEELRGSQGQRQHLLPPNVHRTAQGKFMGRFNYAGIRWYSGTWPTIEEAERAVGLMRRRLAWLHTQGVTLSPVRSAEIER